MNCSTVRLIVRYIKNHSRIRFRRRHNNFDKAFDWTSFHWLSNISINLKVPSLKQFSSRELEPVYQFSSRELEPVYQFKWTN